MMKKNLFVAQLLLITLVVISNAQTETSTELTYLFPESKSWDFGVQISSGIEQVNYPNRPDDQNYNDPYFVSRLGFFAEYHINKRTSLRSEIGAGAFYRLAPTVSF